MGYDAACTLTFDGRTSRGTAWLEHKDLVFRGPHRLVVPLKDVTEARAESGTLHVRFGGKSATFSIGDAAEKWAKRITEPRSRADKLGVKAGMRIVLIGIRDEVFERELAAREASVLRRTGTAAADAVFYAASTRDDLARLKELSAAIAPDGALWIVRPKGRPEITEAETMAAGKDAGLVDVKVVSFSDTHTAEKFVVPRHARRSRLTSAAITPAATPARARRSSSPARRRS
jgi:hypothetical protein